MRKDQTKDSNLTTDSLPETAIMEEEAERTLNPDGNDNLWFHMKVGDTPFKLGLSDILTCLRFAEVQGEIPPLPRQWWVKTNSLYPGLNFLEYDGKEEKDNA